MGIRTKFNPMGGGKTKKRYKAYILYYYSSNLKKIDVSTLGFTEEIDPDTTFAPSVGCDGQTAAYVNYIVLNGKLYVCTISAATATLTRIGNLDNWTKISFCIANASYVGYGIAGGVLYKIRGITVEQVDNTRTWHDVSSLVLTEERNKFFALGIFSNSSYTKMAASISTYNDTINTLGLQNTDFITGTAGYDPSRSNVPYYGYAISGNTPYLLTNSSRFNITTGNDSLTQISAGCSASNTQASATPYVCSFGVTTNGKLAVLCGVGFQIYYYSGADYNNGWTKVTGASPSSNSGGLGIRNEELYKLTASGSSVSNLQVGVQKLGNITKWTDVCGSLNSSISVYALGIANGKLYTISSDTNPTITDTGLTRCIAIYGVIRTTTSIGLAVCEV